jgi:hypothetical protein
VIGEQQSAIRLALTAVFSVLRSLARAVGKPRWRTLLGRKDQFCFKHIREPCGQARPTTEML